MARRVFPRCRIRHRADVCDRTKKNFVSWKPFHSCATCAEKLIQGEREREKERSGGMNESKRDGLDAKRGGRQYLRVRGPSIFTRA